MRMRSGRIESSGEGEEKGTKWVFRHSKRSRIECVPSRVKSKSLGMSLLFGMRVPSTRSSSKNGWHMASTSVRRDPGVYSSRRETRSIASGEVRGRKTYARRGGRVNQMGEERKKSLGIKRSDLPWRMGEA